MLRPKRKTNTISDTHMVMAPVAGTSQSAPMPWLSCQDEDQHAEGGGERHRVPAQGHRASGPDRCGEDRRPGDALLAPGVTRRLIADIAARPAEPSATPAALAELTEREREVLCLVAAGLSNDEIATRLFLSPLTAKTHVSRVMSKLEARDRAQLVVIAYETGLAGPGPRS